MELKLFTPDGDNGLRVLLIVPYGIETLYHAKRC